MTKVVRLNVRPKYIPGESYVFDPPIRGKTSGGQDKTYVCGRCMDYLRIDEKNLFAVFVGVADNEYEQQVTFLLRA
jgi:hypothetical protein